QTCHPSAQRSSIEQPLPFGLALEFPEVRLQEGCFEAELTIPLTENPPEQPAIFGCASMSLNASRVPSEQPMSAFVKPPPPVAPLLTELALSGDADDPPPPELADVLPESLVEPPEPLASAPAEVLPSPVPDDVDVDDAAAEDAERAIVPPNSS